MEKLTRRLKEVLSRVKVYYLHIIATLLILLLILFVYVSDLEILVNEALNMEAFSHVFLIPFFVGFLFYQKKDLFKASFALDKFQKQPKTKFMDEFIGLSLCLIAFLLYWYGSYTFYPLEYHLISLPIFALGITLILFDLRAVKTLIFPILFLFFLVPLPNDVMYTLGGSLASFNTQASYALLKLFGLPVTLSTSYGAPTILLTTSVGQPASFTIDLPCSGMYTLIAFAMFATFLILVVSAPVFKKVSIFVIGFFIFEVLNITRIATIISAAFFFGEEIAMLIFHTAAGLLLIFIGILLTLFVSERFLRIRFSRTYEKASCAKCRTALDNSESFCFNCGKFFSPLLRRPSQKFWAKLIILLIGCSVIVLSIKAPVFAVAQETIEVTSTWENATDIFPQISEYTLKFLYRDTNYEQIAKQDASLAYAYFPSNDSNPLIYVLVGVANGISNLHSWEVCLITWQIAQGQYPLVSVLDSRDIQLFGEGFPIMARYLVFEDQQNYTQSVLYWYEKVTFKTGITVQQKYVRISLMILTRSSINHQQYESQLIDFGKAIVSYWEPIKNQSLISLGVPAQQALLVLSVAFIIIAKTTQYTSEWRKRTNNLKIFNNFASSEDKLVLQVVVELSEKSKTITTRDINVVIKGKIGKFVKLEGLVKRLDLLQGYGFIKRDVVSVNDKPVLVWKSLVNM